MTLKPAETEKSSPTADICKIQCLYCNRKYSVDRNKIPANVSTLKCKACGHTMSLKQSGSQTDASPEGAFSISCLYCSKTYTIDRTKIPENVSTTKCTSCGHAISLKPKQLTILAPKKEPASTGAYLNPPKIEKLVKPDPAPASADQVARPLWKKPWLIAAALALIVIGAGVIYRGSQVTDYIAGWFEKDQKPDTSLKFHATRLPRPFMKLDVNVPLTLEILDQHIPEEKKDDRYTDAVSFISALDVSRIHLYLFPDATQTALPVTVIHSSKPDSLETKLKKTVAIHTKLKKMPDGSYQVKKNALPKELRNEFPVDLYRIIFWEKGAIIVPKSFLPELKQPGILRQTMVSQMAASVNTPDHMIAVAFRIPENIQDGWEQKVHELPGLKQNPQMAMVASMSGGILARMTKPFEQIEALALAFRFSDEKNRSLSYTQRFRKNVDGRKIYEQLNSGDADEFEVDGILLSVIEMLQNPQYQHQAKFKNNKLTLDFTWSAEDDEAFLAQLSQATVGQLFEQNMQLEPSAGPIDTKYDDAPALTANVDTETLKKSVPDAFKQLIFPGNYFAGEEPQMTLTLDKVDFPNAALAELTYDVLRIETPEGKDVLRQQEDPFQFKINPGSATPGHITLNIQKGTPPEALHTAKIRFNLLLPSELQQFEFRAGDAKGSLKKNHGVQVRLGRLEKDVAQIEYRGGEDAKLIAYDGTGRTLASRESMSSGTSISTRFQGVIARLNVVVVRERFDYPFEIDVDLNGGKELALSHKPESPERVRYESNPVRDYVTYAKADLDDLDVSWNEGNEMSWNDSLAIQLPKGPINGQVDWEVHFFAEDNPLYLAGNSSTGFTDTSFSLQKGELQKAHAAFGSVRLNLASDIDRVSFTKESNAKHQVGQLGSGLSGSGQSGSGKKVYVSFNQNEITLNAGKADIIQTMAYNQRGRRLKKDHYTRHQDGNLMMYFWGIPTRFEIDVVNQKAKKTIHFDIRQRPVQEDAYLKFQVEAENQGQVVKTLKAIAAAQRRDRTGYRADVAGLHYVYDRKKKKPMTLIGSKIAQSDPAGQKRFGYRLKPYKGYYFTILSGTESNGVKQDYPRQSKHKMFAWHNGTFKITPYAQSPDLVAIPEDKSQPTFFLQWGQVYMKQLNGSTLQYLPQDHHSQG
ncbi:MAG: zinc-ribbon domain-containing protein [Deltaproteobacteria bacterium]|nr:zinc-ribbon domain-containing protein [Deltaproteobacteria bacterium]